MNNVLWRCPDKMNDPHIEKLYYKMRLGENVDYDNAQPLDDETEDFKMSIKKDVVEFAMKTHCSTEEEARNLVDGYVRGWEIEIGLIYHPDELRFDFHHSEIIDRFPTKTEHGVATGTLRGVVGQVRCSFDAVIHASRGNYILPKKDFSVSPDVEAMFAHYKNYRHNREPLLPMANFCLTVLETSAGGRRMAADQYLIFPEVLNTLGRICAKRGSNDEARKAQKDGVYEPLKTDERNWIEAVVKKIIRRVGEWEYERTNLKQITMKDFPPLAIERNS